MDFLLVGDNIFQSLHGQQFGRDKWNYIVCKMHVGDSCQRLFSFHFPIIKEGFHAYTCGPGIKELEAIQFSLFLRFDPLCS